MQATCPCDTVWLCVERRSGIWLCDLARVFVTWSDYKRMQGPLLPAHVLLGGGLERCVGPQELRT